MSLAPLKFGTVHGRFVAAVADSKDDPDLDPDARPLTGTVTFTPDASAILLPNGLEAPATVMTPPIVAALDDQGYITAGGARGVRLIASDNEGANPVNFTYTVTLNLRMGNTPIKYPGWSISVPGDQTVDLTLVGRVPTSSGTPLTRGVGVQNATAADGVITFLLTDGTTNDVTIQGDIVTDDLLATTARDGVLFRTEVETIADNKLNNSTTISTKVDSAVDAEIAERNLMETHDILEDDVLFAITDEDGKRLWLEAGLDGGPTPYAAELVTEHVAPVVEAGIGFQEQNSEITGIGFAIVDEDGLRTELEVGTDGRFTERVIASLNERLSLSLTPPADPAEIVMPSMVDLVAGQVHVQVYDKFIEALSADHRVKMSGASSGRYGNRWEASPTTAGTESITAKVIDRSGDEVTTRSFTATTRTVPASTGLRLLPIGDSITYNGTYSTTAADMLGGVTVGTRLSSSGGYPTEGRGGWSMDTHVNAAGRTVGDSMFRFPQGIAGEKYRGNTDFWKKVCYTDKLGYDYNGFQKIARDWGADGTPYLFDETGYPVSPTEGDVVYDPAQVAGQRFRQYTSGAWAAMATQPAWEFSFPKYMARYASAFADGPPTAISVMLGTNDFAATIDEARLANYFNGQDKLINSVRDWSATVPIILILPPTAGPQDMWQNQGGDKYGWEHSERMREFSLRLLELYDTDAKRADKIFITSFTGAITDPLMRDWVHPTDDGHRQAAPWLAGTLLRAIGA